MNSARVHEDREDRSASVGAIATRSVVAGVLGAIGMIAFYVVVVGGASGSARHVIDQTSSDWYLLALVIGGFGVQVALVSELHRRYRRQAAVAAAGTAGMGASSVGMVACCAHHLAELLPFLGAAGIAAFLYDYRVAFVLMGVGVNAAGIVIAIHRLRRVPMPNVGPRDRACLYQIDDLRR